MATTYTTTLQKVIDRTRKLTRTGVNTLTDSELITLSNETVLGIERELALNGVQDFGIVATTDIITDVDTNYDKPTNLLKYLRMEINYTDINDESAWVKCIEQDIANLPMPWQKFVKMNPKIISAFDDYGGQFYMAPRAESGVIAGIRLWYIAKISEFTSPADIIEYPLNLYWDTIAYGNAYSYWIPNNKEEAGSYLQLFNNGVSKMVSLLKNQNTEQIRTTVVDITNYGIL